MSKLHSINRTAGLSTFSVPMTAFLLMRSIGRVKRLRFVFNDNYPIEAPEVVFIGKTPEHEHVYSNGFICMSILYDGWVIRLECCDECLFYMHYFSVYAGLGQKESKARQ